MHYPRLSLEKRLQLLAQVQGAPYCLWLRQLQEARRGNPCSNTQGFHHGRPYIMQLQCERYPDINLQTQRAIGKIAAKQSLLLPLLVLLANLVCSS